MKKRIASVLLVLVLLACALPVTAMASGGLSNFVKVNTYKSGHYSDVSTSAWYASSVQATYEYGLMNGTAEGTFSPDAQLTVAEAVKLAACLHSIYQTGSLGGLAAGSPWYKPYVEYAVKNGIIDTAAQDFITPATRSGFAEILSKALPADALSPKNSIADNAIPDVPVSFGYAPAVYELYRAGVLTGCDAEGRFLPQNDITRAEVAAIVIRMANASFRQSLTLKLDLTTSQIYDLCSPAVFFVEVFDTKGTETKTGSGFFIDQNGLAVTNFHVINGASMATITTSDGKKHNVTGIYGYSKDMDLALLQVEGDNFPYLKTADAPVVTGADAWAIGSPLGFKNSISKGVISCAARTIEDTVYIQTTAAISSGSSGGALLDSTGRVVGVTTATATGAQNLNLAVPIGMIKELKKTGLVSLKSILPNTTYYSDNFPVPDFGAYAKVTAFQVVGSAYYYKVSDLTGGKDRALEGYLGLLEDNTFQFYGYTIDNGKIVTYYLNSAYRKLLAIGDVTYNGINCVRIQIMEM